MQINKIINQKIKKYHSGFTMIELMLYIGLVSVFIVTVSVFIFGFIETKAKNTTISNVEEQGERISTIVTQVLRNATSITSPIVGTNSNSIIIVVSDPLKSPTIFDMSAGVIRMKEGAGDYINLNNSYVTATNLIFSNVTRPNRPASIKIQFNLDHINTDNRNVYEYGKIFYSSATLRK